MYVIALANEKGGVAKTTSAISIAGVLTENKNRVLLVDTDPLSCLTYSLRVSVNSDHPSIADVLLSNVALNDAAIRTEVPGLDIVTSTEGVGRAEQFLRHQVNYLFTLKNAIAQVDSQYDFIIIDCPSFLGAITMNALVAANLLLIPTQSEYLGIFGLRHLLDKLKQIRSRANPDLKFKIFLSFYSDWNKVNHFLHEQLKSSVPGALMETVIPLDTKLRESQINGMPITQYAPRSRAALHYRDLVEEMFQILSAE